MLCAGFSRLSFSANSIATEQIVEGVTKKMQNEFKSIWFQRPDRWDFFGSMFFCCTVFTTVGESVMMPY